jgi:hypothetical protein
MTIVADGWNPATLKMEQLNDQDVGPVLEEIKNGQCLDWKDNSDHSPTYKGYWAQWKSLTLRDGIPEHYWESTTEDVK